VRDDGHPVPGGKRSTRVKDLVDLVLIAHIQTVDLNELRVAIAAKRDLSRMGPFEHFDVPAEWIRTYPATAKGVPVTESLSAETAGSLVASFVDPALGKCSIPAGWDPQALAWIPDTSDPTAAKADD
jgi:hypothetical protein